MKEKIFDVITVILLVALIVVFSIKDAKSQREIENHRKQLIALCAAEAHAFMQGWDIKEIYPHDKPLGFDGYYETAISFDAVKKNWLGIETKIRYTVFQGGKVVITGSGGWENPIQQMDLGSSVKFSKIGKK